MKTQNVTSFDLIDSRNLLTGNEDYPFIGDLYHDEIRETAKLLKNSLRYGECLAKNLLIFNKIKEPAILFFGSLMIQSADQKGCYGFEYVPPLEYHAFIWLPERGKDGSGVHIIDVSLPGAIERGLNARDKFGPFLVGREPAYMAGKVPDWMIYSPKKKGIEK